MYNVLIPVDENAERANDQVDALLSLPGDADELSVTILHVYEEIDMPADEAGPTFIEDLNESLDEIRGLPDSVGQAERRLEDAGVDTEREEMIGDPANAILQVAGERDVDAIVVGPRKRSPVGKALFGSVTQKVILEADRNVIIAS